MSAIDPPVPLDDSPDALRRPALSPAEFWLLRSAEVVALIVFLSFCVMWVQWQAAPGISRLSGDFASFWTAGQLALEGHAADAYHRAPHFAKQLALLPLKASPLDFQFLQFSFVKLNLAGGRNQVLFKGCHILLKSDRLPVQLILASFLHGYFFLQSLKRFFLLGWQRRIGQDGGGKKQKAEKQKKSHVILPDDKDVPP